MKLSTVSLITISLLAANNVNAAGYMFPELGMMNLSTAGAGAQAIAEGAETAFANPAAMSEIDSTTLAFSLQGMVSDIQYTDSGSTGLFANGNQTTQAGTAMPVGAFYLVTPLNDKWTAGLAVASAGGSIIDYGQDFNGSLLMQDAQLTTVQFNPSIAYQIQDNLSVGIGLVSEYGMLEQNFGGSDTGSGHDGVIPPINANGNSLEFGYTLSGFYKINDNHRIGLTYRSQIDHDMDGDIAGNTRELDSSVNIVMPAMALMSGHHQVSHNTALMWSLGWTDFSKIASTPISLTNATADIDREWQDSYSASVGVHYQLTQQWRLESGVYYETSPQDDPTLQYPDVPTGSIWKLGLGATYEVNANWKVQMYYEYYDGGTPSIEYTMLEDTAFQSTLQGDYDAAIHFFGVLANYTF